MVGCATAAAAASHSCNGAANNAANRMLINSCESFGFIRVANMVTEILRYAKHIRLQIVPLLVEETP